MLRLRWCLEGWGICVVVVLGRRLVEGLDCGFASGRGGVRGRLGDRRCGLDASER